MKFFLFSFLVFATTFALYAPFWENPFILDDLSKIQENTDLRLPSPIPTLLYDYQLSHSAFRNDPSRPLVYLAYWSCWHLGEGDPWPFHALNTLLHALNGTLLLTFTYLLTLSWLAAGFASALYITAPLLSGTVIYAYGLSDVLSATLLLSMLILSRKSSLRAAMAVMLLYLLALGTKQSNVVGPALILITDLLVDTKINESRVKTIYLPALILSGLYVGLRFVRLGGLGDLEGRDQILPTFEYFSAQGLMLLKYAALLFAPLDLTVDHRLAPWSFSPFVKFAGWSVVLFLSGGAAWVLIRATAKVTRLFAWSWLFFVLALLPTSSFFPTVDLFVERRAFTAGCGILVAAGVLLHEFYRRRRAFALTLFSVLFLGQSALALRREWIFESPERVWQESLHLDPDNPRALVNLAIFYSAKHQWDESLQLLERLTQLQPRTGSHYSKLAYIYNQRSFHGFDEQKAWALYEKSLALDSENLFAWYNAGLYLEDHGQVAKAEEYYNKSVAIAPNLTLGWVSLARVAYKQNKFSIAQQRLKRALELDPGNREAAEYQLALKRRSSSPYP